MHAHAAALRRVPLFAHLDEASLDLLASHSRRRRFPAGESLFHAGDPGQTLYVILGGKIHIRLLTPEGGMVHVASRGIGETVGEMSLVDGKPRMADAVTAEASDLLMLDRSDFLLCLERSPHVALGIMSCLADRLREAGQQLSRLQGTDVLGRVAAALLDLSRGENAEPTARGGVLLPAFSQSDLATELGTTRESVNRCLRRLRDARILSGESRRLEVVDRKKLEGYASR